MKQNHKVAYFLRNLVRQNRQGRHPAKARAHHKGAGNQNTVGKVMECIPDQDGVAGTGTSFLASFDVLGNGVFRRVHMTVMLMTQSELKTEQK